MDSSADNSLSPRAGITDSAWFWLMLFSCVSLIALQLMDWKYNERQSKLERQYQGRQWASQQGARIEMDPAAPLNHSSRPVDGMNFSEPGSLLISLWPLRMIAFVVLFVSVVMLRKAQLRNHANREAAASAMTSQVAMKGE